MAHDRCSKYVEQKLKEERDILEYKDFPLETSGHGTTTGISETALSYTVSGQVRDREKKGHAKAKGAMGDTRDKTNAPEYGDFLRLLADIVSMSRE